MKYTGLLLAFLVIASVAPVPGSAQGLTAEGFENTLSPIQALIEGTVRVGWSLTKLLVGMDDTSIAFFTHQLGFRKDEVTMDVQATEDPWATSVTVETETCSTGSFVSDGETVNCTDADDNSVALYYDNSKLTLDAVGDANDDGTDSQFDDLFYYLIRNKGSEVEVSNSAKGQVMLFALLIPLAMMFYLVADFLMSSGLLRRGTSYVVSIGIALIAARSGVYTGLLSMISSIFGSGGFFLSMLSIYLILAVLLWFYGGIRRGAAIAHEEEKVADAVVSGFTSDLQRGLIQKDVAEARSKKEKK